ncbi:tRNA 2-thiouridine(34) synthase MnmA [Candidatus Anaplasma sp. TIGMIC]|uniref:tRNA 2-thiouridine(34) synthase MnmA n=1 Tax=Candidatus Anaplasma sp. TIGMIC TaxID=3020713 RepID=UPI00232C03F7|nr:tRNA 2-thiouridine(34) synthase MnmA [Candidatus Anaplasma sp. TIGMIC]MDB1135074.1 tRNA 2-thiouridine(34) synthase MnmA [Candidatus Anaplasma sp. TIGMIC]
MLRSLQLNPLVAGKRPEDTTVVVAMSGGVDSSVVSVLLHKLGYKVIGATMQLYSNPSGTSNGKSCCGSTDIFDAKRVAALFGFPHYVLNYEEVFRKEVIGDFINSYKSGETPIPCIKCNQTVKFRDMLKMARVVGGDVVATGHYVRRLEVNGETQIWSGLDKKKDQSYFLFSITLDQLEFVRFPLGALVKSDVRKLAQYFNLEVADKPDSQDICFVSKNYKETLSILDPSTTKKGNIVHMDGTILGEHDGIANFTVGQRKGLGIAYSYPLYVVAINHKNNSVIVGPSSALMKTKLFLKDLNWLSKDKIPEQGLPVSARLRSSYSVVEATISHDGTSGKSTVVLNEGCVVSPGQACVVYDNERMLGGGWILNPPQYTQITTS